MTTQATYKVRDARTEKRFFVDNVIIRGYGPTLGVYGVAVYSALCMHANLETQQGYPSHGKIADLLDCSIGKVKDSIRLLEKLNLIHSRPRYDKETHRQTSNLYTLLTPPMPPVITDTPPRNAEVPTNNPPLDQSYLKEEPALPDSPPDLRFDELPIPRESGANDSITVELPTYTDDIIVTEHRIEGDVEIQWHTPQTGTHKTTAEEFQDRHAHTIDGLVREVEEKREEAAHPDMTDPERDADPWADKPLLGFKALIMTPTLSPSDKRSWPKAFKKWASSWEDKAPTPDETYECIKGIKQSEYDWMTFKTPFGDSFKQIMNIMLGRLRGGRPWNAEGKRNGGNGASAVEARAEYLITEDNPNPLGIEWPSDEEETENVTSRIA